MEKPEPDASDTFAAVGPTSPSPAAVIVPCHDDHPETPLSKSPFETRLVGRGGAGSEIVHVRDAGDGSTFPIESTVRTVNVCWPNERPVIVKGERHANQSTPSTEHWKITFAVVELNANRAF